VIQWFADAAKTQIEERIHDPLVRIDNDLAMVWAPFDFLVYGKVDHCGTDLFNLVRTDGKWLIASVADTGTEGLWSEVVAVDAPTGSDIKNHPSCRIK
jgi:hypothetical protein